MATQQAEEVEGRQTPSDFRIRDYGLEEVFFKSLGFNIYVLQRKLWGEINSIGDLKKDSCLGSDVMDSYNVCDDNFGDNSFKNLNLVQHLVGKDFNLSIFSLKHYHYLKSKLLVQKKYSSIAREIEENQKKRIQNLRYSREEKSNKYCMKRFGFIPNVDKSVE